MRPVGADTVDLGRDEVSAPLCRCHGEPMFTFRRGGRAGLVCRVKRLESQRRYDESEKGLARRRRYNATDHAKGSKHLYDLTRVRTI